MPQYGPKPSMSSSLISTYSGGHRPSNDPGLDRSVGPRQCRRNFARFRLGAPTRCETTCRSSNLHGGDFWLRDNALRNEAPAGEPSRVIKPITQCRSLDQALIGAGVSPAGFEEVVRRHQAMVFSLAWHFLRDRSRAEELAQDVFLQLYQNMADIRSDNHLRHWLRKVTCHRAIDESRRHAAREAVSLDEVPEPATAASRDDPMLSETLGRLVHSPDCEGGRPSLRRQKLQACALGKSRHVAERRSA